MATPISSEESEVPRRPAGVTALSLWSWLWGVAFVWVFLLGLPLVLLGYGLWKLKGWAWWASVLFAALQLLLGGSLLLDHVRWATLLYLSFTGAIFVYLCSPQIRQAFDRQGMHGLPRGSGSGCLWLIVTAASWFIAFAFLEFAMSRPLGAY